MHIMFMYMCARVFLFNGFYLDKPKLLAATCFVAYGNEAYINKQLFFTRQIIISVDTVPLYMYVYMCMSV